MRADSVQSASPRAGRSGSACPVTCPAFGGRWRRPGKETGSGRWCHLCELAQVAGAQPGPARPSPGPPWIPGVALTPELPHLARPLPARGRVDSSLLESPPPPMQRAGPPPWSSRLPLGGSPARLEQGPAPGLSTGCAKAGPQTPGTVGSWVPEEGRGLPRPATAAQRTLGGRGPGSRAGRAGNPTPAPPHSTGTRKEAFQAPGGFRGGGEP